MKIEVKEVLDYTAPEVKVIEVEVEKGFALSGSDFGEEGGPEGGEGDW